MRKISELLALAIPLHAKADPLTFQGKGICFVFNDLYYASLITADEQNAAKGYIYNILQGHGHGYGWLWQYLRAKKKASNLAARVAFYQRLVVKLQKQGL